MTGDAADRCTEPGAVTPEAMLAFLDGVAATEVAEHLRQCPECATEASTLARLQGRLKAGLGRFNCPSPQLLGEYELGFVTPEARTEVARHVLDCPRCKDELHTLRGFLAGDPTADLAHGPREGLVARVRRVVATLFVPPVGTAGAALRGSAPEAGKTYRAGDLSITLGPGPRPRRGRTSLLGLIVDESGELVMGADSTAQLHPVDGEPGIVPIDELGNFTFDDLPPGTYRLELHLPDQVVVIEDITLEA